MCDACLRLGSPWLPALHGGEARPRSRPQVRLQLARHTVKRPDKSGSTNAPRKPRQG